MSAVLSLKKEPPKKPTNFSFLKKDRYFVMRGYIDMNNDVLCETF